MAYVNYVKVGFVAAEICAAWLEAEHWQARAFDQHLKGAFGALLKDDPGLRDLLLEQAEQLPGTTIAAKKAIRDRIFERRRVTEAEARAVAHCIRRKQQRTS